MSRPTSSGSCDGLDLVAEGDGAHVVTGGLRGDPLLGSGGDDTTLAALSRLFEAQSIERLRAR